MVASIVLKTSCQTTIDILEDEIHLLNPLNKNPKEAEIGNGSYIMGSMLFKFKNPRV